MPLYLRNRFVLMPDVKPRLTAMGFDPVGSTLEQFARHIC
jgi:hypothetical protein